MYVSNSENNTIEEFGTNGVGSVFASTDLDDPFGLAFDSAGNLYVANYANSTIVEFGTNGDPVSAYTGLDGPTFIAIEVPEPASWTMAALGFSTLPFGWRLRGRSP